MHKVIKYILVCLILLTSPSYAGDLFIFIIGSANPDLGNRDWNCTELTSGSGYGLIVHPSTSTDKKWINDIIEYDDKGEPYSCKVNIEGKHTTCATDVSTNNTLWFGGSKQKRQQQPHCANGQF